MYKYMYIYIYIYIYQRIARPVLKNVQCENKIVLQFNEKCHCVWVCVWVCEKIIARTSFLIKKYAWLVSNVRERCKEEAVKICERIDVQLLRAEPAPIGRSIFYYFRRVEIKNHSWHFRMSLQEFYRTLNLVNRLIRPSAYLFQLCAATNHANKYPQAWADSEAAMTTARW